jgi:hypothetical protein
MRCLVNSFRLAFMFSPSARRTSRPDQESSSDLQSRVTNRMASQSPMSGSILGPPAGNTFPVSQDDVVLETQATAGTVLDRQVRGGMSPAYISCLHCILCSAREPRTGRPPAHTGHCHSKAYNDRFECEVSTLEVHPKLSRTRRPNQTTQHRCRQTASKGRQRRLRP